MTAQDTNRADREIRSSLEEILQMVRTIDENVVEILDAVADHSISEGYDPAWDYDEYFRNLDY